jgi:hypothetical protein
MYSSWAGTTEKKVIKIKREEKTKKKQIKE